MIPRQCADKNKNVSDSDTREGDFVGFRFRKSVNLGPVRLNFSKSGVGYSVGGKFGRYTKKANGGTRTTYTIPGTGVSYVKDHSAGKKTTAAKSTSSAQAAGGKPPKKKVNFRLIGGILAVLVVLGGISSCMDGGDESQPPEDDTQQAVEDTIQEPQQDVQEPAEGQETSQDTQEDQTSAQEAQEAGESAQESEEPGQDPAEPAQEPQQQPQANEPEPEPQESEPQATAPDPAPAVTPEPEPQPDPAPQENQSNSRTVYITPTGKKYHYDNNCNGGTYIPSTLAEAQANGLTPCKKCAGG